jgi:hypothetical protein
MPDLESHRRNYFSDPGKYRIVVGGKIDEAIADTLAGMSVIVEHGNIGNTISVLEGQLRDQAALSGVLNRLYELHLAVISVELLNTDVEP